MRPTRPSMQELIGRRKRAGFVGRRAEIDRFRGNFDVPPEDERHSFVFHVHGTAGVGKSSLLRELEAIAAGRGAITATTDEAVSSVPEAMEAISAQFARQGVELKALDKLLATYRQRRHEAETASAAPGSAPDTPTPTPASLVITQAGLVGLGMVPGVGAFTGAMDPAQVALGADKMRAALTARFRSHEDVQLVLEPLRVLTPAFVEELNRVAEQRPWITLFFDTYERTSPFLDAWLLDVITSDRYGTLPGNVVVGLAGQYGPDPARWGDYAGFVREFALEPFTESEARQLLAARGVVDERLVRDVLRLSDCLPVLVSTLAEHPGDEPGAMEDPAATAVDRFLRWERDPGRREAAMACSFPRHLDEDVFRAVVDGDVRDSYAWLRGLPFVSERAGRVRYHDVVRTAMLRLQRKRSPRTWAERHARLAEAYGRWRAEAEHGLVPDSLWYDQTWRELRAEESYHVLCAGPRAGLKQVLGDVVEACRAGTVAARACAQALHDAGEHTDAEEVRTWGRDLLAVLSDESDTVLPALGLLLDKAGLEAPARAEAHSVRGRELRQAGEFDRALVECERAVALDPTSARAHYGRGVTHAKLRDHVAALADLERADELRPDTVWIIAERGEALQMLGRNEEALALFDHALSLDPTDRTAWANRAYSRHALGDENGALADFDRALEIDGGYLWALVHRAEVYRSLDRGDDSFADLDRAVELAPDVAWVASERGDAYRLVRRYEEAVEELGRACTLAPDYASAHAGRGMALVQLNRLDEAGAAFDRAIELAPEYTWALLQRASLRGELGDEEGMFADLDRAVGGDETGWGALAQRGIAYAEAGRDEEALLDFDRVLERRPGFREIVMSKIPILHSLGRADELLALLDQFLDPDSEDTQLLELRGLSRLGSGRYLDALHDFDRLLILGPDATPFFLSRAVAAIALGRLSPALQDLRECVERDEEAAQATGLIVQIHLWRGQLDEARQLSEELRAEAEADAESGSLPLCWLVDAMTGHWERAGEIADRVYRSDPEQGGLALALTVGVTGRLDEAERFWREVRQARTDADADAENRFDLVLTYCALADWSTADAMLAEGLALDHRWDELADLAMLLTLLARCPGIDQSSLAPRLARVVEARDAMQARYAE
ncbi:tetratricopeptide repeat protein [Streptomyces sp. CA-249302]|uniref:tetratricopeptide repeat protein n=1 Tax=Streptomyces sp. CA-249302 TaxID=3240058 RepID=UPI003D8B9DCA